MSKHHKNHQAPDTDLTDALEAQADAAEVQENEEKRTQLTEEEKEARIRTLLYKLRDAKANKDTSKAKKLRRQLRSKPLFFFISKAKERVMEILLEVPAESAK